METITIALFALLVVVLVFGLTRKNNDTTATASSSSSASASPATPVVKDISYVKNWDRIPHFTLSLTDGTTFDSRAQSSSTLCTIVLLVKPSADANDTSNVVTNKLVSSIATLPYLQSSKLNIVIAGVGATKDAVTSWAGEAKLPSRITIAADEDSSVYGKLCQAGSPVPRSYVLNAKREVVYQGVGYVADEFTADFLECVKQELAE